MDFMDSLVFHISRNSILSLIVHFHDDMFLITLVHSPYLLFSHDLIFMSPIRAIWILSV